MMNSSTRSRSSITRSPPTSTWMAALTFMMTSLVSGLLGDAGELLRQRDIKTRIVDAREPLLVGGQAAHVVHLEEELARTEGVTGILPGQLQQTKALRCCRVLSNKIAVQIKSNLRVVQIGLARDHKETWAAELPDALQHVRIALDREGA